MSSNPMKTGWAAGTVYGGEWLTVWGSAHGAIGDLVFDTRDEAEARAEQLRSNSVPAQAERVQVRYVEMLNRTYFRILPEPQPTDAELLAAIDRGIEAGALTEITDEWLAERMAELDAEDTTKAAQS